MEHVSNERKAREIAEQSAYLSDFPHDKKSVMYGALEAMQWKDKERKELWRITRNHYQEWAEEQIAQEKQKFIDKCKEFCDRQTIGEYYNRREIFQIDKYIDDMLNFIKGE